MRRIGGPLLFACWMAAAASAKTDRFVWTNSPAPTAPYTNWTTAARTIQAAVDVCEDGDTVVVTNGVYAVGGRPAPFRASTNRVMATNAILVQSVNGPKETVIRGQGPAGPAAVRGAYLTNGATLSGFRLENGHTPDYPLAPGDEDPIGGGAILSADCRLFNCDVVSNAARTLGGGVYGYPGATVEACTLDDNSAEDGGGVYLSAGTLLDSTCRDNLASPGFGGGAYLQGGSATNCAFYRNNGYWGGGLMLDGGTASGILAVSNMAAGGAGLAAAEAVISEARLFHNTAYDFGGGAYLEMCWFSDSVVSNNNLAWQEITNVAAYGAGIASTVSLIENCILQNNWGFDGDDCGGGIACSPAGPWTNQIIDCSIRGNSAGDGGGIFVRPAAVCALSTTGTNVFRIRENVASNFGGGVCVSTQAALTASGRILLATNSATFGGGLAARAGAQATLVDANGDAPVFYDNTAADSGGGLYAAGTNAALTLRNVRVGLGTGYNIHGNRAQGTVSARGVGGGGIALMDGAALTGCNLRVEFNQCPSASGGGILIHHAQVQIASTPSAPPATAQPASHFANNSAQFSGGAIYSYASPFVVQETSFFENAADNGGAIYMESDCTGRLDNVVVAGNVANFNGGGIRIYDGSFSGTNVCDLRHCTIYGNAPNGIAAGVSVALSLTNCIVWSNAGMQVSPGYTVVNSDVQGGYAGVGNVDADPFFRDPAAFDFHLTLDSTGSVVEAGSDAGFTNDCVFRARPLGAAPDMGAFEYNPVYDDSDGDGIPDRWEADRGLDARDAGDGPAHGDGDGRSNYEEYLADTDPLASGDFFRLTDCAYNPSRPDRGIFVGFTSSSNRLYDLYSVPVVSNGCAWTAMTGKTNYAGVGNYDGFNDTNAPFDGIARVYRVAVHPLPE